MTESRRPIHLAVLVGVSASAYAVSLAGVTALQATTDARITADRAPADHAVDAMTAGHDRLESSIDDTLRAYRLAADRYTRIGAGLETVETSLEHLGARVEKVTGAANALPGRVSLPKITTSTRTVTRTKVVHATTGASG